MGVYEWYLSGRIRHSEQDPPETVAVVLTERDLLERGAYDRLEQFFGWVFEYDTRRVLLYVSVLDERVVPSLKRSLQSVSAPHDIAIRDAGTTETVDAPIQASVGLGGREEFAHAVRSLASQVDAGTLEVEEIAADHLEEELVFPDDPDLVIKTGAERLSDFLIWQSVYAELYFTDVNWRNFRKRDYLRAILEFMHRQRRFGR